MKCTCMYSLCKYIGHHFVTKDKWKRYISRKTEDAYPTVASGPCSHFSCFRFHCLYERENNNYMHWDIVCKCTCKCSAGNPLTLKYSILSAGLLFIYTLYYICIYIIISI